jgi:hypothetical protein
MVIYTRPGFSSFVWGTSLMKGVCSSLNITYKLFNPDGKPIRAICKVTIREVTEEEQRVFWKKITIRQISPISE